VTGIDRVLLSLPVVEYLGGMAVLHGKLAWDRLATAATGATMTTIHRIRRRRARCRERPVPKPALVLALSVVACAHTRASSNGSIAESTSTVVEATRVVPGNPTRPDGAVSPIELVSVADVTAVEEATSSPGLPPMCGGGDSDPPHVCPGTTPAPSSPTDSGSPPPPPD
jgi:hypothetical protein